MGWRLERRAREVRSGGGPGMVVWFGVWGKSEERQLEKDAGEERALLAGFGGACPVVEIPKQSCVTSLLGMIRISLMCPGPLLKKGES